MTKTLEKESVSVVRDSMNQVVQVLSGEDVIVDVALNGASFELAPNGDLTLFGAQGEGILVKGFSGGR